MLNFAFLEKGLGIVSPWHFAYDFSKKNISHVTLCQLTISLPDCLYFLRYWSIRVLQLLFNEVVTSKIFEINLSF